jgi:hypothetical protein
MFNHLLKKEINVFRNQYKCFIIVNIGTIIIINIIKNLRNDYWKI